MSKESLGAIDDAVKAHLAEHNPGEVPSGWVLTYSTLSYENEALFGNGYCTSDSTDPARAVGLVEIARLSLRRDMGMNERSDDDD